MRSRAASAWLVWLSFAISGCGIAAFGERSSTASQGAEPLELSLSELGQPLRERRLQNLDTHLHPGARALVHAQAAEQAWARDAIIGLPAASCAAAVGYTPEEQLGCALIALGAGRVAVLVMSDRRACDEDTCLERSWVFLSSHSTPLPLPARRLSDYRSLRAVLSSDRANALWVAGFRSYGDRRIAELDEAARPGHDEPSPRLADYKSCAVAPDGRELVCRTTTGDVLAIDPLVGASRLVAQLGIAVGELPMHSLRPVWWTTDGRMAVSVAAIHHRLCGEEECELVGLIDWPRRSPTKARMARADTLPW